MQTPGSQSSLVDFFCHVVGSMPQQCCSLSKCTSDVIYLYMSLSFESLPLRQRTPQYLPIADLAAMIDISVARLVANALKDNTTPAMRTSWSNCSVAGERRFAPYSCTNIYKDKTNFKELDALAGLNDHHIPIVSDKEVSQGTVRLGVETFLKEIEAPHQDDGASVERQAYALKASWAHLRRTSRESRTSQKHARVYAQAKLMKKVRAPRLKKRPASNAAPSLHQRPAGAIQGRSLARTSSNTSVVSVVSSTAVKEEPTETVVVFTLLKRPAAAEGQACSSEPKSKKQMVSDAELTSQHALLEQMGMPAGDQTSGAAAATSGNPAASNPLGDASALGRPPRPAAVAPTVVASPVLKRPADQQKPLFSVQKKPASAENAASDGDGMKKPASAVVTSNGHAPHGEAASKKKPTTPAAGDNASKSSLLADAEAMLADPSPPPALKSQPGVGAATPGANTGAKEETVTSNPAVMGNIVLPDGWKVTMKLGKGGRRDYYWHAPEADGKSQKFDSWAKVKKFLNIE